MARFADTPETPANPNESNFSCICRCVMNEPDKAEKDEIVEELSNSKDDINTNIYTVILEDCGSCFIIDTYNSDTELRNAIRDMITEGSDQSVFKAFRNGRPIDFGIEIKMAHFAEEPQPAAAQGQPPAQCQTPQSGCCQPTQTQPAQTTPQPEQVKSQPLPKKTCPHCKAEIDELEYKRAIIECGTADTDGISRMIDFESDENENEMIVFSCPNCHVALFTAEEDAVDFLSD